MLKMYYDAPEDGGSTAYWEEAWADGQFEASLRFCEVNPPEALFGR